MSKNNEPIVGYMAEILVKENTVPIFHASYNVPFKLREAVSQEIDTQVKESTLVPIKFSRYATPIVIVPKSDGRVRICMDCRVTLNKCVETEHYPLPKIEDIFAMLSNCTHFCKIDLKGAYLQLSVSPESRQYLTINTFKGLYQYTRLPLGIKNGPSIFQSVMDQILVSLEKVFCYLDDIIVGGFSEKLCYERLLEVFQRLHNHNVHINLEKCEFLVQSVKYLGHTVSILGISPNPEKVKAITEAPVPVNVSQLQSYLGLLNYYGRFIPNLSEELRDLYKLLRKEEPFCWSGSCKKAFERSKKLILSHSILELYDPNKPIVVATDASPYGVGEVLSHIIDGHEKIVLFASSTLSPAEKNYSQLHREALAIVFALKKFHSYLYGQKFTICTDHQALKEIFNPKKSTPAVGAARLQRWSVIMSMYNYDIVYRKCSLMCHADALSRLPLAGQQILKAFKLKYLYIIVPEEFRAKIISLLHENHYRTNENDGKVVCMVAID